MLPSSSASSNKLASHHSGLAPCIPRPPGGSKTGCLVPGLAGCSPTNHPRKGPWCPLPVRFPPLNDLARSNVSDDRSQCSLSQDHSLFDGYYRRVRKPTLLGKVIDKVHWDARIILGLPTFQESKSPTGSAAFRGIEMCGHNRNDCIMM